MKPVSVMLGCDRNILSCRVLESLVRQGHSPCKLILSGTNPPAGGNSITHRALSLTRRYGFGYCLRAAIEQSLHRIRFGIPSTARVATAANIPFEIVHDINSERTVNDLTEFEPGVLLVAGFDQILRTQVIGVAEIGVVNLHPSLLPAYRGPDPVFWALARRETQTGVTAHLIDEGIDTGDILHAAKVDIPRFMVKPFLEERLACAAGELASLVLDDVVKGNLQPIQQSNSQASYFPKPTKNNRRRFLAPSRRV